MVEVIASYEFVDKNNPDSSFVKGHVIFNDYSNNEVISDDDMYTDKYMFALYVIRRFWNSRYKWDSFKIYPSKNAVLLKGEKI